MIIRYGGGNSGIKEYLESGRKMDRHFERDEMDRRIPIDGDLTVTEAVYNSIDDKGQDRYLHITLSFNEPDVTPEKMDGVYQQYKEQLMCAYKDDEFNIYAEIHWPKIKQSYNHVTGNMDNRYPHIHVVIPKRNLVSGGLLNPIGMHEKSLKYLDAIQEKLNRDNQLSSPRDNPRIGTNHYESALSKYKDIQFESKNGNIKRDIYNKIIERDIRTFDSFKSLLDEYGSVKVRNAKSTDPYLAVKLFGDAKYTNLKDNIFNTAYIENRSLVLEPVSDAQVSQRVDTWQKIQSREIKYISNASSTVKAQYKSMSLTERRDYLQLRENQYEQRFRKPDKGEFGAKLSSELPRNYKPSDFEFAARITPEGASDLHELRTRDVDHFDSPQRTADRLFLSGDEDDHLQYVQANGDIGLRHNLYVGAEGRLRPSINTGPDSSALGALIGTESDSIAQQQSLLKYAEIRKSLDPYSLLAYVQNKYGVDPSLHPISTAKDGSPRIKAGKYNYNVSDFLTKHIGLSWAETSETLDYLYQEQLIGNRKKPKSMIHQTNDWRTFRDDFKKQIDIKRELKGGNLVVSDSALKAINNDYYSKRKSITSDSSLTKFQKHYLRSVVILEKLQHIEDHFDSINTKNSVNSKFNHPYSTLFYNFVTEKEDFSMKILKDFKAKYQPSADQLDSQNLIGASQRFIPANMPSGAEAAKRARLVAQLREQATETKELKLKLGDLRPQPLASGAVAFTHKEHGKQIFINHPDRLELNRVTEPDEVAVSLIYAVERFGSPLDIKGTEDFQRQVIQVAAERDMNIAFTDDKLNEALAAKRLELGMSPLPSNSIGVAELEIDKTLPLDQAVEKALFDSKVAELTAISEKPEDDTDALTRRQLVNDMLMRHQSIELGITDDKQIKDIALEDIAVFKNLEGKAEQQEVALAIYENMQSKEFGIIYSAAAKEQGPSELMLTIDAARHIQSQQQAAEIQSRLKQELDIEASAKKFIAALEKAKNELAINSTETAAKIQERSILYKDSFVIAKEPELLGITDISQRLKILNTPDIETISPDAAREWANIDVAEYKKIEDAFEKQFAAIDIVSNINANKTYADYIHTVEPELVEKFKTIDTDSIKSSLDKESEKEADSAMQIILAKSALIEINMRHQNPKSENLTSAQLAKLDLESFSQVVMHPEERAVALKIDQMMQLDDSYRIYITQNAQKDLFTAIDTAQADNDVKQPNHNNDFDF